MKRFRVPVVKLSVQYGYATVETTDDECTPEGAAQVADSLAEMDTSEVDGQIGWSAPEVVSIKAWLNDRNPITELPAPEPLVRQPVESSNIASVGWRPMMQRAGEPVEGVLEVEFRDGSVYAYAGVPMSVYTDFLNAESKGKFFHRNVKGQYNTEKLTE